MSVAIFQSMRVTRLLLLSALLLLLHPCDAWVWALDVASADSRSRDQHPIRRLHGDGVHKKFYCSLEDVSITQVAINETTGEVIDYDINDNNSTIPLKTYAVKPCNCFFGLLDNTAYCPADTSYCFISIAYNTHFRTMTTQIEDHDPSVTCYRDTPLKAFARSVFNYWTVIMTGMTVFLIWSGTARHIVRHLLSRYNPEINARYVERTLRREIQVQRQRFFRWRESFIEAGCSVGLKIKTKIYKGVEDKHGNDEGVDACSICLLDLKDGDRIADLSCKHSFHADCLAEWIKKKNSCPLCQTKGIAKDVLSNEIEIGPDSDTIMDADTRNGLTIADD